MVLATVLTLIWFENRTALRCALWGREHYRTADDGDFLTIAFNASGPALHFYWPTSLTPTFFKSMHFSF